MSTFPTRTGREELLAALAAVEDHVWRRGGVDAHPRRRAALLAAIAAGCSLSAVADVLGVSCEDVAAWTRPLTGR